MEEALMTGTAMVLQWYCNGTAMVLHWYLDVRVQPGHVLSYQVVQLSGHFHSSGPAAHLHSRARMAAQVEERKKQSPGLPVKELRRRRRRTPSQPLPWPARGPGRVD